MRRGKVPTNLPRILIDQSGSLYDVRRPQNTDDSGEQTDSIGEYVGDTDENMTVLEDTLLYFHDRRKSLSQKDGGERMVDVIESSSYPDSNIREDDRVTHNDVEWECQTVDEKPHSNAHDDEPVFLRARWERRQ